MIRYRDLFVALRERNIRYLVAGGFAVNLHKVNRATVDLDLILHLEQANLIAFIELMEEFGFRPRLPVNVRDFANPVERQRWIKEKNMTVFSFIRPQNPFETIDIFVKEPKPFSELDRNKLQANAFGIMIPVIGLEDLIALKQIAGRPKDLLDIDALQKRLQKQSKL